MYEYLHVHAAAAVQVHTVHTGYRFAMYRVQLLSAKMLHVITNAQYIFSANCQGFLFCSLTRFRDLLEESLESTSLESRLGEPDQNIFEKASGACTFS